MRQAASRLRLAAAVGVALVAAMVAGCDVAPCSREADLSVTTPELTDFDMESQLPEDPYTVIFRLEFEDSDGNLGEGGVQFYLNGEGSENTLPLVDAFRQVALPEDATSGALGIPLRFQETVTNGARVLVGAQLVDGDSQYSNCGSFSLGFAVEPL